MKLELRYIKLKNGKKVARSVLLITESENESKMLDQIFGCKVTKNDGFISSRQCDRRLSDGYTTDYLTIFRKDP